LAINHRLKSQRNTGITKSCQVMRPDLNSQVSEKPGAVQTHLGLIVKNPLELFRDRYDTRFLFKRNIAVSIAVSQQNIKHSRSTISFHEISADPMNYTTYKLSVTRVTLQNETKMIPTSGK